MTRGPDLHRGDLVGGKYLLLRQLSEGGMGQVWCARNLATGAEVAIKALRPELASSSDELARFRDEAHATAQLAHRAIVRIFDLIERDAETGHLLIVMELLHGHTLAQRLANLGPLSIDETLAVALPLLSGLSHAHGAGVIHRDVKPANVLLALEPDGKIVPKLLDFGVSQLGTGATAPRRDGFASGTPWYMSPEQARGEEVDARCDVFGVGILLYECLAGTHPFRVAGATSDDDSPRLPVPIATIPARLWAVIARALAERSADRFSSALDLAAALRHGAGRRNESPSSTFPGLSVAPGAARARLSVRPVQALGIFAVTLAAAAFAYRSGIPTTSAQECVHARTVLAPHAARCMCGSEGATSAHDRPGDRSAALP